MTPPFPCIPTILGDDIYSSLLTVSDNWPEGGNQTISFLAQQLSKEVNSPPSESEKRAIDSLCRKVDIVKKIHLSYDGLWKTAQTEKLAPGDVWALLSVHLIHVSQFYSAQATGDNAEAIKYLNSALNATENSETYGAQLTEIARQKLNEILGQ